MEDRRTRTDGAKKRHSESVGGLLRSWSAVKQTGRLPDSGQVVCRFAGAWVARLHVVGVQSCGVNGVNFNALPMLGRSFSKAVQGSAGNRQNLPRVGSHAQHDFQALEDGDKSDIRAVRVAVCAGDGLAGSDGDGRRPEPGGGNNGGAVGRRNVFLLLFARARIRSSIRLGSSRLAEPPEGGECAPCRRPKAGSKAADEREQGKERDAEAGRSRLRRWLRRGRQDGLTADGGPAGGGKEEAAGGNFGAKGASDQRQTAAERPGVQPGRPPTAPRRTAEAQPRPSGASTSGAAQRRTLPSPASSRARSLGAEGLACRLASSATGMTSPERLGRTLARGRTPAEARSRAGAVAPPTTQQSGTPGAAKQGA